MNDAEKSIEAIEQQIKKLGPTYLKRREAEFRAFEVTDFVQHQKQLETLGHRMKGSAKTYGYEHLGVLGAQLETAAHDGDVRETGELVEKIIHFISNAQRSS